MRTLKNLHLLIHMKSLNLCTFLLHAVYMSLMLVLFAKKTSDLARLKYVEIVTIEQQFGPIN